MKRSTAILWGTSLSLLVTTNVEASNPFSDVEKGSWSYQALEALQEKGIIEGYPDGSFKGQEPLNRYEMAQVVAKAMAHRDKANAEEEALINRLAQEYRQELDNLGVQVDSLESKVGNVNVTGDMRLRYLGSDSPKGGQAGYAYSLGDTSYFDLRTRLKFNGRIDDKTSLGIRLNSINELGNTKTNSLWFDQLYVSHQLRPNLSVKAGRYEQSIGNGLAYLDSFDGLQIKAGTEKFNVEGAYGYMVTDGFKKLSTQENPSLALVNLRGKVSHNLALGGFWAHISDGQIRRYDDSPTHPNRMYIEGDNYYGFSLDYEQGRWWAGGEWLKGQHTDKTRTWTAGLSYGTFTFAKQKQGTWLAKLQYISEEQYSPVITSAYAFGYDLSTPRMSQYDGYKGWMATGRYALWDNAVLSSFIGFDSKDQSGHRISNYYRAEINLRF